jgi:hypothetical protein
VLPHVAKVVRVDVQVEVLHFDRLPGDCLLYSPIISPLGETSMSSARGCDGRPGKVSIWPARAYRNPAPTDALMSTIGKV